jgi:AcrR family transcriptional regulator
VSTARPGNGGRRAHARTGRRAGDSGTRAAILDSARQQFAAHGYDGATIRGIATVAGVDPALVHHFYGTKERLFASAMQLPVVPSEFIGAALADGAIPAGVTMGEHMVATALELWEGAETIGPFQALLRSAVTSEQAAAMLREFLTEVILAPVATATRGDPGSAPLRAGMVASQMLGLAMARYVLKFGPVVRASRAELVAAIGPNIERYLTGDIS